MTDLYQPAIRSNNMDFSGSVPATVLHGLVILMYSSKPSADYPNGGTDDTRGTQETKAPGFPSALCNVINSNWPE